MARKRLTMRKIKEVIRLKYEAGLSNRAIASACKVSNSTVGEYLKRAEQAGVSWPLGNMGEDEIMQRLYPEMETVKAASKYPMPNWEEVQKEKRKKGVTLQLLWQEYKAEYPDGYQYSQYCEHFRRWKKSQTQPRMHKEPTGGETMEVDYAGLKMAYTDPETGERKQVSVFVATLPASNYLYAEAQSSENQRNWNNGHARAFEYFGGVPKILVPDNLKTGITRPNYYEPGVNLAYQELAEHYQVAVLPARVKEPRDKGAVENGVQQVERWLIAPLRDRQFFSLREVKQAISEKLEIVNHKVMKGFKCTRRQAYEEIDLPNMRPLPIRPYEYAERKMAIVHLDYHVEFDDHLYSVPFTLIHEKVDIRATETMIEIFHKGKSVAIHPRNYGRKRFSTRKDDMPANHQFMSGINSEYLIEQAGNIGPQTMAFVKAALASRPFPEQSYRTCLGILRLARKNSSANLEQACRVTLEAKEFSYKAVEQELVFLQNQKPSSSPEPLPAHDNIRGSEYYQERSLL